MQTPKNLYNEEMALNEKMKYDYFPFLHCKDCVTGKLPCMKDQ